MTARGMDKRAVSFKMDGKAVSQ